MSNLTFTLGGHTFVVSHNEGVAPTLLPPAYTPFATSPAGPIAASYEVVTDLPSHDGDKRVVWKTETWRLLERPDGRWTLAIHVLPDEHPVPVACIERDFSGAALLPIAGRHGAASPHAMNYPCDQVVVMNRLLKLGALVVHASAVSFDGTGLLFCGRSGAGKTTLARIARSEGAVLLNDDRQILHDVNGTISVSPTPWHGLDPEVNAVTAPLRAIFHLVQAPATKLTPIHGATAAARLMATAIAPFYLETGMQDAINAIERITTRVPSYILEFTPDADTVRLCRGVARP